MLKGRCGTLELKLNEIASTSDKPFNIVIQADNVINGLDLYSVKMEETEHENIITFQYKNSDLNCRLDETKGELSKFKNINKISDLKIIFEDPAQDWYWLDLYVVLDVARQNITKGQDDIFRFVENYGELFV